VVKHHGENSQSAQAIELGQIGLALHATVAKAFLSGDTITSNAASEDSFIKVCSAQRQKSCHASEESDRAARDALARQYCRAAASEEYRRDLKKIYAQLEEARGWGGPEVTELREEKWERALAALLRRARKTDEDALEGSQKRQVENTHSAGTTINLNGDKCMDR
jgi:hypothetical protein